LSRRTRTNMASISDVYSVVYTERAHTVVWR